MGVSQVYAALVYSCNGATVSFPVTWEFFAEGDLIVTEIVTATGAETVKTISTDYDVTGGAVDGDDNVIATPGTGAVVALVAPASGLKWRIERSTSPVQGTSFTSNDSFPPKTVEGAYDRRAVVEQELRLAIRRAIKQTVANYITSGEIAFPAPSANSIIGWNDDGTGLDNKTAANLDLSVVSTFISTLLDDANAAAARATLGLTIGTNVQAYDADLVTWASLSSSANFQTLVAETYAQMRASLDLEAGVDFYSITAADAAFQAKDAQLSSLIRQNSQSAAYGIVATDSGYDVFHPVGDNNARTFTIPAQGTIPMSIGTVISFTNMVNTLTIAITSDTLTMAGSGSTGSRTLAANGVAVARKITLTQWIISGVGLT